MASAFREALSFFGRVGVYDVVLPFLMIFTIVFAILEKSKVLGMEEIEGQKYTRKNLNAMVAFCVAFFAIASSRIVEIITQVSAQMVILLLLSIFFMLLVGSFWDEDEGPFSLKKLGGPWVTIFTIIMFVGILAIFMMAIKTEDGTPWLTWVLEYVSTHWSGAFVGSIILMLIIIGFMAFVISDPNKKKSDS